MTSKKSFEEIEKCFIFYFIQLGWKKLQPKIIIAENVKGLLHGEAKYYLVKFMQNL